MFEFIECSIEFSWFWNHTRSGSWKNIIIEYLEIYNELYEQTTFFPDSLRITYSGDKILSSIIVIIYMLKRNELPRAICIELSRQVILQ